MSLCDCLESRYLQNFMPHMIRDAVGALVTSRKAERTVPDADAHGSDGSDFFSPPHQASRLFRPVHTEEHFMKCRVRSAQAQQRSDDGSRREAVTDIRWPGLVDYLGN